MLTKRPAPLPFLIGLLVLGMLAGCEAAGSTPPPTPTLALRQAAAGAATITPATTVATSTLRQSPSPLPTDTLLPTPTSSPSPTAIPIGTPTGTPTGTPAATATPTLPPQAPPLAGAPLAFSLGWRLDANEHLTTATVDLAGSQPQISLASLGRTVYALSGHSGSLRWHARTTGPVYALALLAGSRLAVGDDAGAVTVLDAGGRPAWQADLGSRVTALHAAPGGELLAGGWDERLSLFGAEGQVRWQVELGAPVSGITTLPVEGTGLALVAALDGQLRAFDLEGQEAWRFDAGTVPAELGTVLAGGQALVLLGAQDGRLLALDPAGALQWQRMLGTGAPIWHAAGQLDGGRPGIVAGTGGATPGLVFLSAGDGQIHWHISLPAAAGAVTLLDMDRDGQVEILAGLTDGQVQAYDLQGRLRGAVHAGLAVWGMQPLGEGSALILAGVAAWQVSAGSGPGGGPWLPPPAMLPAPTSAPPPPGQGGSEGGILVFLGDVAFGRSMEAQLARYGPAFPWQGLGPLLGTQDPSGPGEKQQLPVLTVANLECALTTRGQPLDKSYLIRAHPMWARSLVAGGVDLVTLANNHALDFGPQGLDETTETLEALDIEVVGAGVSYEAAHRPAFFDLGGVRVALLGYAAARWDGSVDIPATDRLAWARPEEIRADVKAAREEADVVVILLHAGSEYAATPSPDQVAAARAAIDAGAALVVGHHPHVTQTVERYGQGLIVYSLGDAVFDIPRPAAMRGHLLRVHVTDGGLVGAELWPFWIDGAIQPRLLDGSQGTPLVEQIYP